MAEGQRENIEGEILSQIDIHTRTKQAKYGRHDSIGSESTTAKVCVQWEHPKVTPPPTMTSMTLPSLPPLERGWDPGLAFNQ